MSTDSRESLEASIVLYRETEDSDGEFGVSNDFECYTTPTGSLVNLSDKQFLIFSDAHEEYLMMEKLQRKQEEHENEIARLREENKILHEKVAELVETTTNSLSDEEVENLREQLREATSYVDQVDVEAEQQYTELTEEIDELIGVVETKDSEIKRLKDQLNEKLAEIQKLHDQVQIQKTNSHRHGKIVEEMQEEIERLESAMQDLTKEKEKISVETSELQEKLQADKDKILAKEVILSIELEDVQRELQKQREIIRSTSIAQLVDKWEQRVIDLENQIREREVLIHTQQHLLNELRKGTNDMSHMDRRGYTRSGGSSSESFHSNNYLDDSSRNLLISYILGDKNSQLANVYAISRILDLTGSEESFLERNLRTSSY